MTHPLSEVSDYPVCEGVVLTPEFLAQKMWRIRMKPSGDIEWYRYHRHPKGGGWVADSAIVPSWMRVPVSVTIGPNTELIDDRNLAGQYWIEGDMYLISRRLTEQEVGVQRFWRQYIGLLCVIAVWEDRGAGQSSSIHDWIGLLNQVNYDLLRVTLLSDPFDSVS